MSDPDFVYTSLSFLNFSLILITLHVHRLQSSRKSIEPVIMKLSESK